MQITPDQLRANLKALYARMANDTGLQSQFVHNPAGLLFRYGVESPLGDGAASAANRLLFSVLNNSNFLQWVAQYSAQNAGTNIDQNKVVSDLAAAIQAHGDENLIAALADHASHGDAIPGFGPIANQVLINNAAGEAIAVPVAQPPTSDQSLHSSQNFDSNGVSLGGGDIIDPGLMRTVANQMVAYAQQLAAGGRLADIQQTIL